MHPAGVTSISETTDHPDCDPACQNIPFQISNLNRQHFCWAPSLHRQVASRSPMQAVLQKISTLVTWKPRRLRGSSKRLKICHIKASRHASVRIRNFLHPSSHSPSRLCQCQSSSRLLQKHLDWCCDSIQLNHLRSLSCACLRSMWNMPVRVLPAAFLFLALIEQSVLQTLLIPPQQMEAYSCPSYQLLLKATWPCPLALCTIVLFPKSSHPSSWPCHRKPAFDPWWLSPDLAIAPLRNMMSFLCSLQEKNRLCFVMGPVREAPSLACGRDKVISRNILQ